MPPMIKPPMLASSPAPPNAARATSIVCFPLAGLAFWLVPGREVLKQYQLQGLRREAETEGTGAERARELLRTLEVDGDALKFDYVGSFLVVAAAVLSVRCYRLRTTPETTISLSLHDRELSQTHHPDLTH
jgi:hypothetical protein